jgi:hypothetical protein
MRDLFSKMMTGSMIAGAALLVAACGGTDEAATNTTNVTEMDAGAMDGGTNDVTAIDAGAGMDANMSMDANGTMDANMGNAAGDAGMNAGAGAAGNAAGGNAM